MQNLIFNHLGDSIREKRPKSFKYTSCEKSQEKFVYGSLRDLSNLCPINLLVLWRKKS
jgi:hypothetical protein